VKACADLEDADLLKAYGRGQEAAFSELVRRWGVAVKAYSLRMLKSPELAEEVYVETFLRAAAQRGRWEERGSVRGWLFTIAHRQCIDLLRRRKLERESLPRVVELETERGWAPSPEAQAVLGQTAETLERALLALPEEHRTVMLLRVVHGLSSEETADVVGIAEDQVRNQLSYARKRLRDALVPSEGGGQPAVPGVRTRDRDAR
jgi:RNA polymerase sigma-70 factor (ECF subfamily)